MRKWRPTHKAIYVIPEIHGNINSLEIILNRILPLRKFKNQEDILVMMGDYIDGDEDGAKVIDCLINIKQEYNDRVFLLKGNHEELMTKAILGSDEDFNYWIDNNGISTIKSYLNKSNLDTSPYSIKRNRMQDIVPKSHIDFLRSLSNFSIIENYIFFHGGFNIEKSILENTSNSFVFDYTASKLVKDAIHNKMPPTFKDDYIYVGSHNYNSDSPFVYSKYFMLGGSAPSKILVFELNSMSACACTRGKSRIYKYDFRTFE